MGNLFLTFSEPSLNFLPRCSNKSVCGAPGYSLLLHEKSLHNLSLSTFASSFRKSTPRLASAFPRRRSHWSLLDEWILSAASCARAMPLNQQARAPWESLLKLRSGALPRDPSEHLKATAAVRGHTSLRHCSHILSERAFWRGQHVLIVDRNMWVCLGCSVSPCEINEQKVWLFQLYFDVCAFAESERLSLSPVPCGKLTKFTLPSSPSTWNMWASFWWWRLLEALSSWPGRCLPPGLSIFCLIITATH